jgi:hypothetical protein
MLEMRLRVLGPAACCALAILSAPAAGATRTTADARPQALWQAYPLTANDRGVAAAPTTSSPQRVASTTLADTTTAPHSTAAPERSPTRRTLVVVAAVVVGIVIGLIPALIVGAVIGVTPWPRLRRRSASPATSALPALELADDDTHDPDAELYFGGQRYRVEDLRRTISARLATQRDDR